MLNVSEPTDSREDRGTIAFEDFVTIMQRARPTLSRPIKGLGKRAFIPYVFQFGGRTAEFFCEATIVADPPSEPDLGYTMDDVGYFEGVTVFEAELEPGDGLRKPSGEVLGFEEFLDIYVQDRAFRGYLRIKMEDLHDAVQMDERNLETINDMWAARDLGEKIVNVRLH